MIRHCPEYPGDIRSTISWIGNEGTPDYFNRCSNLTSPLFGVPNNYRGNIAPYSGDGYIGLVLFGYRPGEKLISNYKINEFVWTKLNKPLEDSCIYKISFKIALSDSSYISSNYVSFSLSSYKPVYNNKSEMFNFKSSKTFVCDISHVRNNWVAIEKKIINTGDNLYFSIGLSRSVYSMKEYKETIKLSKGKKNYTYYYIDDIKIEKL